MKNEIYIRRNIYCVLVSVSVYVINSTYLKNISEGVVEELSTCYINDFVCPLFFLGIAQLLLIWADCRMKKYVIVMVVAMSAALFWEYVAPYINSKSITDIGDIVCYFFGANLYYFIAVKTASGKN